MTKQELLHEIRTALLDGRPVTVDTIMLALDRLTDKTNVTDRHTAAVALLRGYVPNPVSAS